MTTENPGPVPGPSPQTATGPTVDRRIDPLTGQATYVVGARQGRPNLPTGGCPFCVGGLEAPEPYDVKAFPNRWPALGPGRAEVVLYSPVHEASLWTLGPGGVRKVIDLWAERTAAMNAIPEVAYTLVFENRGSEIGATIPHPHGQIYAFDHVPPLPETELSAGSLDCDPGRVVSSIGRWDAWVPLASPYPYALRIASTDRPPELMALDDRQRDDLAHLLVDTLGRFDALFETATPYMMWIHQRPADAGRWPGAQMHIDIVTPWRARGVIRFIAAGEIGSGEFFNTIVPEDAAHRLRSLTVSLPAEPAPGG